MVERLPAEVFQYVLRFVPTASLPAVALVNSVWKSRVDDPQLWAIHYRDRYHTEPVNREDPKGSFRAAHNWTLRISKGDYKCQELIPNLPEEKALAIRGWMWISLLQESVLQERPYFYDRKSGAGLLVSQSLDDPSLCTWEGARVAITELKDAKDSPVAAFNIASSKRHGALQVVSRIHGKQELYRDGESNAFAVSKQNFARPALVVSLDSTDFLLLAERGSVSLFSLEEEEIFTEPSYCLTGINGFVMKAFAFKQDKETLLVGLTSKCEIVGWTLDQAKGNEVGEVRWRFEASPNHSNAVVVFHKVPTPAGELLLASCGVQQFSLIDPLTGGQKFELQDVSTIKTLGKLEVVIANRDGDLHPYAVALADKRIRIWSLLDGQSLYCSEESGVQHFVGLNGPDSPYIAVIGSHPFGKTSAVNDRAVQFWRLITDGELKPVMVGERLEIGPGLPGNLPFGASASAMKTLLFRVPPPAMGFDCLLVAPLGEGATEAGGLSWDKAGVTMRLWEGNGAQSQLLDFNVSLPRTSNTISSAFSGLVQGIVRAGSSVTHLLPSFGWRAPGSHSGSAEQ